MTKVKNPQLNNIDIVMYFIHGINLCHATAKFHQERTWTSRNGVTFTFFELTFLGRYVTIRAKEPIGTK